MVYQSTTGCLQLNAKTLIVKKRGFDPEKCKSEDLGPSPQGKIEGFDILFLTG
jgi:hypothetical protein